MNTLDKRNSKIAIIGLGYVGLPLAVEFGKDRPTIGFDTNKRRIKQLFSIPITKVFKKFTKFCEVSSI